MKKIFILALIQLLAFSCSKHESIREFTFIYDVELESSKGEKIELWLPIPQSNEVQIISNLKIDSINFLFFPNFYHYGQSVRTKYLPYSQPQEG